MEHLPPPPEEADPHILNIPQFIFGKRSVEADGDLDRRRDHLPTPQGQGPTAELPLEGGTYGSG